MSADTIIRYGRNRSLHVRSSTAGYVGLILRREPEIPRHTITCYGRQSQASKMVLARM